MFGRIGAALKAFTMTFSSRAGWWWSTLGRTRFDYAREVGSGRGNSIVEACVLWIQRTFPEAPVRVSEINTDGEDTPKPDHPFKLLLDTPNSFYPGELLWAATLADRTVDGNAYWLKVRSGAGRPVELWWVPSSRIEPKWPDDGSVFISHYEYTPLTQPIRIDPKDVVHFRYGIDPLNPRKGLSPIKSLLREIFTDDEAATYTATMLRNVGVPPVIVSPKLDKDGNGPKMDQAAADEVKDRFQNLTTGDERGKAIVMRGATEVHVLGFNPKDMDTRSARRVPEERVSAVLGIPAAVVGLGTGLENTKVGATMAEMREQAYESNIIPTQRLMAAELRSQLLVDFGDVRRLKVDFDLSEVRVLQADQNDLHQRAREDLKAGGITLNEFREMIELEPLKGAEGDMLFIPKVIVPTKIEDLAAPPAPAPAAPPLPPGQPAKVLSLLARRAKAVSLGEPLNLTQDELDAAAAVTPADIEAARALWLEEAPKPLAALLDAQEAAG